MIAVKATFQTGVALFIVMEFIQVLIDLTIGWRFIPSSEQIWYIQRGESAVLFDRDIACVGISTQPEYYLCNFWVMFREIWNQKTYYWEKMAI